MALPLYLPNKLALVKGGKRHCVLLAGCHVLFGANSLMALLGLPGFIGIALGLCFMGVERIVEDMPYAGDLRRAVLQRLVLATGLTLLYNLLLNAHEGAKIYIMVIACGHIILALHDAHQAYHGRTGYIFKKPPTPPKPGGSF